MDDLVIATQFGIFVFDDIKTMRTGSDDLFNAVIIQELDVVIGHHLEKEFVPGSAGRVAGTHFLFAQYRVIDSHLAEDGCKSLRDLLGPLIKAAGTSHPEEDLRIFTA